MGGITRREFGKSRGDSVLNTFLRHDDADVVALCDLYQPYIDFAATSAKDGWHMIHSSRSRNGVYEEDVQQMITCAARSAAHDHFFRPRSER